MNVKIIDKGNPIILLDRTGCEFVYIFTWNDGNNKKMFWETNKKNAIEQFQLFAKNHFEPISKAYLWCGDVRLELYH